MERAVQKYESRKGDGKNLGPGTYRPRVYRPSPFWTWLYSLFFRFVQVDARLKKAVEEAPSNALFIYVARATSFLDFLALDFVTKQMGLPLIRFCSNTRMSIVEPFDRGSARLRLRSPEAEDRAFRRCLSQGGNALIFLSERGGFAKEAANKTPDFDPFQILLREEERLQRPIVLLPLAMVWTTRPPSVRPTLFDMLLGPVEWPGRIRSFLQFAFNFRNARLRVGEAMDFSSFVHQCPEGSQENEIESLNDEDASRRIRMALFRRIERERNVVQGPTQKTKERTVFELMQSPRLREVMAHEAERKGESIEQTRARAQKIGLRLVAALDTHMISALEIFFTALFSKVFERVEVDEEGIERLKHAARKGPLVLLPTHKSHIDYLVMSYILVQRGISVPLVAAGDNLAFFPIGWILRRSGAFFIRRSFRGDALYSEIVDTYVRRILVRGSNVEIFLEGGRSRTGKLMPPKTGMLQMVLDAQTALRDRSLQLVPISIAYERLFEESSYAKELEGAEKKKEGALSFLKSSRILGSSYGRVYVHFGEIIDAKEAIHDAIVEHQESGSLPPSDPALHADQIPLSAVRTIAHRVTYATSQVIPFTYTGLLATTLLSRSSNFVWTSKVLVEEARKFHAVLFGGKAFDTRTEDFDYAIYRSLLLLSRSKHVSIMPDGISRPPRLPTGQAPVARERWRDSFEHCSIGVVRERRSLLEYPKNAVIHFHTSLDLVAAASIASESHLLSEIRERAQLVSKLFKYEFHFEAGRDFDDIFEDCIQTLKSRGAIVLDGDKAIAEPAAHLFAASLASYAEVYLRVEHELQNASEKRDILKNVLAYGRKHALTEIAAKPKIENAFKSWQAMPSASLNEGEHQKLFSTLRAMTSTSLE